MIRSINGDTPHESDRICHQQNRISLSLLAIAVLLGLSVVTVILSETDPLGLPMQIVYADPGISAYASK